MKKLRPFSTAIEIENRMEVSNNPVIVPKSKLLSGSLENKYPVILDDGKTVIYISDKKREKEILARYGRRKKKRALVSQRN